MSDPKLAIMKLENLRSNADRAGLYAKAARFADQARKIAEGNGLEEDRIKHLLWQGYYLEMAGETDIALPLLIEAANCRAPEADPADVYNAANGLIEISLGKKTSVFCRDLITQTRNYLNGINKRNWSHMLDWLDGRLDFNRGDFQRAQLYFLKAREGYLQCPYYPYYTEATYLFYLCESSFYLHDLTNLNRWVETIESCTKEIEGDRMFAKLGRLQLFRAKRTKGGDFSAAPDFAISILDMLDLLEIKNERFYNALIESSRTLMLACRWQDLEHQLTRFKFKEDFKYFLFRGDEGLCRAREALGMPVQDDEYDDIHASDYSKESILQKITQKAEGNPKNPLFNFFSKLLPGASKQGKKLAASQNVNRPDTEKALIYLEQAAEFYEKTREEASSEDERLETDYYTRTLEGRLERANAIENAVKTFLNKKKAGGSHDLETTG